MYTYNTGTIDFTKRLQCTSNLCFFITLYLIGNGGGRVLAWILRQLNGLRSVTLDKEIHVDLLSIY